jgi:hypothetical protein
MTCAVRYTFEIVSPEPPGRLSEGRAPDTGGARRLPLWRALGGLSLFALLFPAVRRRRRKRRENAAITGGPAHG